MSASLRFLAVMLALAIGLPATATETAPAGTPAPTTTVEATASPAAPTTTQAAKPVDAAPAKSGDGQAAEVTRVPPGYKSKVVDGETMLCRKSTPLGTRFPTEVCMTAAQYEESVRQQDGLRQELTGKQKSYSINR